MKKVVVFVALIVVQCAYGSFPDCSILTEMVPQQDITQDLLYTLASKEALFKAGNLSYTSAQTKKDAEKAFINDLNKTITLPLFQGEKALKIFTVTQQYKYTSNGNDVGYAIVDDHTSLGVVQVRYLSEMYRGMFKYLVECLWNQYPSQLITVSKSPTRLSELNQEFLREIPLGLVSRLQLPLFDPCGNYFDRGKKKWIYYKLRAPEDLPSIYRIIPSKAILEKEKQLQEELDAKIKALREQHQTSLQELQFAACACIAALPARTETLPLATPYSSPFGTPSSSRALSPVSGNSDSDNSDSGSESNDSQDSKGGDRESSATHDRLGVHADGTVSFGLPGDAGYRKVKGRMPIVRDGWFDACVIS